MTAFSNYWVKAGVTVNFGIK